MSAAERIPAGPFLAWCDERLAAIRRELDTYPAITASRRGGGVRNSPRGVDPQTRLVLELGWSAGTGVGTGERRLSQWRRTQPRVRRDMVEDALEHAGSSLADVYPDLGADEGWSYSGRLGRQRYMTDREIIAAHVIYTRERLTAAQLGALVWQRYGYASADCCARQIALAFERLGLPARQCAGIRSARYDGGGRCEKWPLGGNDYCAAHARPLGWTPPLALIDEARDMHERGMSFRAIGYALIDHTPWKHPVYAGNRIREIAQRDGWYYAARAAA